MWLLLFLVLLVLGVFGLHQVHLGVIVLHYHAINDKTGKEEIIAVRPDDFTWHMNYLKKAGYTVIPLEQAVQYLTEGTKIPKKAVAISFDDGYVDNFTNAFPILNEFDYPATVFLATGEIGGVNIWDLDKGYAKLKLMDWEQILTLEESDMTVMPHTVHHVDLTKVPVAKMKEEINQAKDALEQRLERPMPYFSYPYSGVNDKVVQEVQAAGFQAAFTSAFGTNLYKRTDLYRIKRMPIKEIHKGFWGRLFFVVELKLCSLFPW